MTDTQSASHDVLPEHLAEAEAYIASREIFAVLSREEQHALALRFAAMQAMGVALNITKANHED